MLAVPRIARRSRWLALVLVVGLGLGLAVLARRGVLGAWIAGDVDAPAPSGGPVAFYTCSMDPSVQADHPRVCPICGMALTPVTQAERASGAVRITLATQRRIGLAVAPVESRPLHRSITASGIASGDLEPGSAGRAVVAVRVYRGDAAEVQAGQAVSVAALELPLVSLTGEVVGPPAPDAGGAFRVAIDDPGGALRPGIHVEIQIDLDLPPRLVVPAVAVIHAGARRIVFVDRGNGRFEPREPKLGRQAGAVVELLDGLAEGDRVVVKGTFLIAAESRLRSDGALWTDRPRPAPVRPRVAGGSGQP